MKYEHKIMPKTWEIHWNYIHHIHTTLLTLKPIQTAVIPIHILMQFGDER